MANACKIEFLRQQAARQVKVGRRRLLAPTIYKVSIFDAQDRRGVRLNATGCGPNVCDEDCVAYNPKTTNNLT